ncbi:ATP-binding cassette domain-containing protein [Sphaerimonospora sp. CA-214678]|uniref:branched-chain amino acid ABC transporter ATP-binding protein/permease n=1 Tax=Sphaerimonospora sp. CA-214678 TaxID=3240029 RepID=UPI003D92EF70
MRTLAGRLGGPVVLVLVIALAPVVAAGTADAYYYVGLLSFLCVSVMLTLSLNIATGYGGMLTLMQTGLQLLGGYSVALCMLHLGMPWLVAIGVAMVLCLLLSLAVVLLSLRSTHLYFGMLTLVANLVLVEIGEAWVSVTGGNVGLYDIYPTFGGETLSPQAFFYIIAGFAVAAYVIQHNYVGSTYGRATMAIRESNVTASSMGINPTLIKLLCFGLAGALGGAAGGLFALQLGAINPSVGLLDSGLIFFVGLFIGGVGTLVGPVLGTILISVVVSLSRFYPGYNNLVMGLVLLLVLAIMPKGIAGTFNDLMDRRRSRAGEPPSTAEKTDGADEADILAEGVADAEVKPGVTAIEAIDVKKHYGGVKALDGVSVRIETGRIHGIIGPNGSGKSTLVDCLTRFQRVTSGEVRIFGSPAPVKPHQVAALGVTRVFQIPRLFGRVGVLDNVLTGMHGRTGYGLVGALLRSPRYLSQDRTQRTEARRLLRFAGLEHLHDLNAETLSHGQKRLLEVVRAVATRPSVLILDEPATGLTGPELGELARLCRLLRDHGLAVVLIEHNIELVMSICDVVTVLDGGKVIAEGTPETVRTSEAVRTAYLGSGKRKGAGDAAD